MSNDILLTIFRSLLIALKKSTLFKIVFEIQLLELKRTYRIFIDKKSSESGSE